MKPQEPADAVGLIAEALKRKFAHRYSNGQEDKEDFRLPVPEVKPQTAAPLVRNQLVILLSDLGNIERLHLEMLVLMCFSHPAAFVKCFFVLFFSPQFGQHMLKQTGKRKFL